jgi:hypothetical protein
MDWVLQGLDLFSLAVWRVSRFVLTSVFAIVSAVGQFVRWLWRISGRMSLMRPVWRRFDAGFGIFVAVWNVRPVRGLRNLSISAAFGLGGKLETSKRWRRVFLLFACVVAAYLYYPPSHWGPWRHYQTGIASHYGRGFYLQRTANMEWFVPFRYTAAHRTLPLGIMAKVVNLENGRVVYVRINDRGPYVDGRILDLSTAAGKAIGLYGPGTAKVAIYVR